MDFNNGAEIQTLSPKREGGFHASICTQKKKSKSFFKIRIGDLID